ncbi:MAG: LysR family transcriptional regulator [Marinomonas foliarum]|jgi:DNA-binding transcriptional LysR family regulator|uniref:DNA-binding transcriptional LysR family regulator n=1 Tax=Marinomonas foliarum TaxID=491950 RepID=A0A368ZDV5_9GAMM|nr:LysR family transcriptional regulator [Marinomonas foliarum]QRV23471.1 LysR family transcriptional regulator [Marinomonas foliarum]RCW90496.1 DNA-binding transcriptional LysR family regulator [Marinomonas foliarum]
MNPNLLKQLAIVVKQGSLSRACEQLYITQPTLTRSIQQLEMKVGAPVLVRTRYGVQPTEIGARLAQIGERILAETEQGEEVIRQFHSGYHNEFVIGIDPLWEFATVAHTTAYFMQEKHYVFHFRTGSAAAQIELLQNGELDFLLAPAHLSVKQGTLDRQLLFRDRSGVFVGKKSALRGASKVVSHETLEKQNWIVAGANAGFLDRPSELIGLKAASMAFTGSIRSVLHLLNTSDVLVRLPARLALMTGEVDMDQMIQVSGPQGPRRDIALWSKVDNLERPECMKVHELIRGFMQQLEESTSTFDLSL